MIIYFINKRSCCERAIKSKKEQIEVFEFILENVRNRNKILNLHSAQAEDKVLNMLIQYDIKKAIFHWYSGKIGTLNKILDSGYYFSINSNMCKSKKGQNIISRLPKNKILVETDAPFINDLPYKNLNVYYYLSELWNLSLDEVRNIILRNFFNLQNSYDKLF